jgi:hypothetical protein
MTTWQADQYVVKKSEVVPAYREAIGDTPDDFECWVVNGALSARTDGGRLAVAAAPCHQARAARMLGQVIYPHDPAVARQLQQLAQGAVERLRRAASRSLQGMAAQDQPIGAVAPE